MSEYHRIPAAHYLKSFVFGGARELLNKHSEEILPEEYEQHMRGHLYCPGCTVPLVRVPHEMAVTSSGNTPHFRHSPGYSHIDCGFRTTTPPGRRFNSKETINKAIEDGTLSVISNWLEHPANLDEKGVTEFSGDQVIDKEGEESSVPLGEHSGESIKVPSRIQSVLSLFVNFAAQLPRYFYFPGSQHPILLKSSMVGLNNYSDSYIDTTNVFYGKISGHIKLDYRNIIKVRSESGTVIHVYTYELFDKRRRIDHNAIGKTVAVHGKLESSGHQIRIMTERWGQYCLVPKDAEKILLSMEADELKNS